MEPQDHYTKALRFEKSTSKLDPVEDCETIVESCMLGGTNLVNCLLHHYGILDGKDISHTHLVRIDRLSREVVLTDWSKVQLPEEVASALDHLRKIEDFRPVYVRGMRVGAEASVESLAAYNAIKAIYQRIANSE